MKSVSGIRPSWSHSGIHFQWQSTVQHKENQAEGSKALKQINLASRVEQIIASQSKSNRLTSVLPNTIQNLEGV
jgi:hypothetical protein